MEICGLSLGGPSSVVSGDPQVGYLPEGLKGRSLHWLSARLIRHTPAPGSPVLHPRRGGGGAGPHEQSTGISWINLNSALLIYQVEFSTHVDVSHIPFLKGLNEGPYFQQ